MDILNEQTPSQGLTEFEAASGLKSALEKGAQFATKGLSQSDGFLKNEAVKILFPPEFKNVEQKMRQLGLSQLADDAVLSFNRAAEKASAKALPILQNAVTQITFADAMEILLGEEDAATMYLKKSSSHDLEKAFLPIVKKSADEALATKYWNDIASSYNRIPFVKPVQSDISAYITSKTLAGLFLMIEKEEKQIRKQPLARTNDLLKKVFAYADKNKNL